MRKIRRSIYSFLMRIVVFVYPPNFVMEDTMKRMDELIKMKTDLEKMANFEKMGKPIEV